MRVVMLGGAPGIGKSIVARHMLMFAEGGSDLVQWVDVDDLWLHQPWRLDERMRAMVQANLHAVAGNAAQAGIDILLVTWVFQSTEMHDVVTALLPANTTTVSVQLRAGYDSWCRRFETDPTRSRLTDFYRSRYHQAQATPADHVIDTGDLAPVEVAYRVAAAVGLTEK